MSRRGFSLAEVAMGVAIAIALSAVAAGAGSFTMKKAKENEVRETVKDFAQAQEAYMSASQQRAGFDPVPQSHLATSFERFRANPNLALPGRYTNPYTMNTGAVPNTTNTNGDVDGAIHAGYAQADYGLPRVGMKGWIEYTYRWPRTKMSFQVWDGAKYVRFQYYMFQAIDDRGYPIVTLGR